jgi:hypothetical protein
VATLAAVADVFLITQVAPGDGAVRAEAVARESLMAAGVVGSGVGAVPPHRALFCTTRVGRIALARQVRTPLPQVSLLSEADSALGRLSQTRRGCTWTAARMLCESLLASAHGWCMSRLRAATASRRCQEHKLLRR